MRRDTAKALADYITQRTCTLKQLSGRCAIFIDQFETTHFWGGTWKSAVKSLERNWSKFEPLYEDNPTEEHESSHIS